MLLKATVQLTTVEETDESKYTMKNHMTWLLSGCSVHVVAALIGSDCATLVLSTVNRASEVQAFESVACEL